MGGGARKGTRRTCTAMMRLTSIQASQPVVRCGGRRQVYGPESSGKTTLAMSAVASVQRAGGTAVLIDAEHAYDPVYCKVVPAPRSPPRGPATKRQVLRWQICRRREPC